MNDVAAQQPAPIVRFKRDLQRLQEAGELALPSTVPFDAFRNAAVVAVTDNPQLLHSNLESLFKSLRTLAGAGLVPDGREAAITIFGGKAQAMPMVAGLIKVARNSGKISSLWADVIYEGETLDTWVEDGEQKWNHVLADGSRIDAMGRGGRLRGAYAVAKLTDGSIQFQPMTLDEIEKRRKASPNQKGAEPTGIWQKWYSEMALKTVIRNLCKRLPMSSDDIERIMKEQEQTPLRDVTPDQPEAPRKNFAQKIAEQNGTASDPEGDVPPSDDHAAGTSSSEGEIIDAEPSQYAEGEKAFKAGMKLDMNPHEEGSDDHDAWASGWNDEKKAAEE